MAVSPRKAGELTKMCVAPPLAHIFNSMRPSPRRALCVLSEKLRLLVQILSRFGAHIHVGIATNPNNRMGVFAYSILYTRTKVRKTVTNHPSGPLVACWRPRSKSESPVSAVQSEKPVHSHPQPHQSPPSQRLAAARGVHVRAAEEARGSAAGVPAERGHARGDSGHGEAQGVGGAISAVQPAGAKRA